MRIRQREVEQHHVNMGDIEAVECVAQPLHVCYATLGSMVLTELLTHQRCISRVVFHEEDVQESVSHGLLLGSQAATVRKPTVALCEITLQSVPGFLFS